MGRDGHGQVDSLQHSLLKQSGLPYPRGQAIAWNKTRSYGDVPVYNAPEGLAEFLLSSRAIYPMFCKPVKGSYGYGTARLESHEARSDSVIFSDGSKNELLPFLRDLKDGDGWGFLFQEAVRSHPDMKPICGDAVSGCRVIMLLDDKGAYPYKVVWKIPAGNNHIDNFNAGAFGNLAAALDVRTGRVIRVVSGKGANLQVNLTHPDTGYQLLGTKIPLWDEMMQVLKKAAESFPGFRWQHWDVGLGVDGPVYTNSTPPDISTSSRWPMGKASMKNHCRPSLADMERDLYPMEKSFLALSLQSEQWLMDNR